MRERVCESVLLRLSFADLRDVEVLIVLKASKLFVSSELCSRSGSRSGTDSVKPRSFFSSSAMLCTEDMVSVEVSDGCLDCCKLMSILPSQVIYKVRQYSLRTWTCDQMSGVII